MFGGIRMGGEAGRGGRKTNKTIGSRTVLRVIVSCIQRQRGEKREERGWGVGRGRRGSMASEIKEGIDRAPDPRNKE
jgi:hypothetical protein